MWVAGYLPMSYFRLRRYEAVARLGVLAVSLGGFYADHVRFELRHPYIAG